MLNPQKREKIEFSYRFFTAFSAVKFVIKLDKTVFFLRFCEFNM